MRSMIADGRPRPARVNREAASSRARRPRGSHRRADGSAPARASPRPSTAGVQPTCIGPGPVRSVDAAPGDPPDDARRRRARGRRIPPRGLGRSPSEPRVRDPPCGDAPVRGRRRRVARRHRRRQPQRVGRLDRDDLGGPGLAAARDRPGTDPRDHRDGGRGRLPDPRPRRHECRPAALRAPRVRGPDVVPDPRGARPRRRTADPRMRPFRVGDLDAMATLDAAATGEDRRHLLRAFASPDTAQVLELEDGSLGGFVVRASWGGGATIAPRLEDALADPACPARGRWVRQARPGRPAGRERGRPRAPRRRPAGPMSWRAPRLVRGDPLHWHPKAIWGQFNHALG